MVSCELLGEDGKSSEDCRNDLLSKGNTSFVSLLSQNAVVGRQHVLQCDYYIHLASTIYLLFAKIAVI